jgi:hypothetical protein
MAHPKQLTVLYEHPHWFTPLFNELEQRNIPFRKIDASSEAFDPSAFGPSDVLFNRISPSSWLRGRGGLIFQTRRWLHELEDSGVDVINGAGNFEIEVSKAEQLKLLAEAGVRAPRARVIRDLAALPAAGQELEFPLIIKPNVGGSGAGIRLFRTADELSSAVESGDIDPPFDGILLLQEYHAPKGQSIVRVETLDTHYLYGIRIHLGENAGFDLCPADVCKTTSGEDLTSAACPVGAQKKGLTVEAYTPPAAVIAAVQRIAAAARLDVGGIEYLESSRDGEIYYYDVNSLSNFVAEPLRVIGFDPTARLVDSIEARLGLAEKTVAGRAS